MCEQFQVVAGLVSLARAVADEVLGRNRVLVFDGADEDLRLALVVFEQRLEIGIAQPLHLFREVLSQRAGQPGSIFAHVAVGNAEGGEAHAGFDGHFLVDALQPLHEAANVVIAVTVGPDVVDNLLDGAVRLVRRV